MKIVNKLALPALGFLVLGLVSCNKDEAINYSTKSLKNTELMTVLKSKGYKFDKDGKLELNDLAEKTTALDLSGTKLKDLSGLDVLPNLKDVKLSNNGYGPVFDFAQLPAQITGVDLTGNDIHNYKNLVNVKIEENDDETVTNLHNITKLYLPAEAKYNIKELVRFYRKNKDDIESGKIDMKIADEKGNMQKYNTLRSISNTLVFNTIKKSFPGIISSDGEHIDLNKILNPSEKTNDFSLRIDDESSSPFLDGVQYIVENPYWEGESFSVYGNAKRAVLPYVELGSKVHTFILKNVDVYKKICYDYAFETTSIWFDNVLGLTELDLSHSTLFGQRDPNLEQDGLGASSVLLYNCPDFETLRFPEKNDLCASSIELINLPKFSSIDLTPFKQLTRLGISTLAPSSKIVYPDLRTFPSARPQATFFGCNEKVFMQQETKKFIKKYYGESAPHRLRVLSSPTAQKLSGEMKLIRWTQPKYIKMLNN